MRRPLVVGILKEDEAKHELRAPLSPADVRWLTNRGIEVEVQSSPGRIFKDFQYRKAAGRATLARPQHAARHDELLHQQ